jgi:hypothetical protein
MKKSEKPEKSTKKSGVMVRTSTAFPYEMKGGKPKKIPTINKMTPIEDVPKKMLLKKPPKKKQEAIQEETEEDPQE